MILPHATFHVSLDFVEELGNFGVEVFGPSVVSLTLIFLPQSRTCCRFDRKIGVEPFLKWIAQVLWLKVNQYTPPGTYFSQSK